jgi:transposase-like protein
MRLSSVCRLLPAVLLRKNWRALSCVEATLRPVTLSRASLTLGIPRATLRTWVRRGQVVSGRDSAGQVVIDVDSLKDIVDRWDKRHAA